MKKKNYLWSLLAIMMVGLLSVSLVSCGGSDDDDNSNTSSQNNNPGQPGGDTTTLPGTWQGFVIASGDGMVDRYSHKMVYIFNSDKTFKISTAYGGGTSIEKFVAEETVTFYGNYSEANGKLTFNINKRVDSGHGYTYLQFGSETLVMNYTMANNTLTLGSDDKNTAYYGYHHLLIGTLNKVSSNEDKDEPSAVLGVWTRTETSESGNSEDTYGKMYTTQKKTYHFQSDGTYEFTNYIINTYEKDHQPAEQAARHTGTFTYKDNLLTQTTTWTGFWDWQNEKWQQQGSNDPFTTEFIVTVNDNSLTIALKNDPSNTETYTK